MTGRMWSVYSLKDLILIFILFFVLIPGNQIVFKTVCAIKKDSQEREREKKTALCGSN